MRSCSRQDNRNGIIDFGQYVGGFAELIWLVESEVRKNNDSLTSGDLELKGRTRTHVL